MAALGPNECGCLAMTAASFALWFASTMWSSCIDFVVKATAQQQHLPCCL
jgi:hypothetical protein